MYSENFLKIQRLLKEVWDQKIISNILKIFSENI